MTKIPDRLNVEKGERKELYETIDVFKGKSRKEQFFIAMAFGFKNGVNRPLNSKEGFFLTKDLRIEDEALLNVVAISDKNDVKILSDKGEIYKIAEGYAHAGIKLLSDKIKTMPFGSFDKEFEKELVDYFNELKIEVDNEENTSS